MSTKQDGEELDERFWEAKDLLEDGDPESALELVEELLEDEPEDPDYLDLKGQALLDLGDVDEALVTFRQILALDSSDVDARAAIAETLLETGDLDGAKKEITRLQKDAPDFPGGFALLGYHHDIEGRAAEADAAYGKAAELDPEYEPPTRLDDGAFHEVVEAARSRVPPEFDKYFENVAIVVQDFPSLEMLRDPEHTLRMSHLGYFDGVPMDGGIATGGPLRVFVFKRGHERAFEGEELIEEVNRTLLHELGHALGLDEDDMERLGLD